VVPIPDDLEVKAMRRSLIIAVCTGLLALMAAGTAAASSFDPATQTGFISRGEVITAGGKLALIADPMVSFTSTTRYTLTCTWPDQTQRQTEIARTLFILFRATTRYAPGTGLITGYSLSPSNVVDGDISPPYPDATICWGLLGRTDDGTPVAVEQQDVTHVDALTFFGPSPFALPFK
jgi:hypothetical protein